MRRDADTTSALTPFVLLDAIRGAAVAHGEYEVHALGGIYDQKWAEWYAEYMAGALAARHVKVSAAFLAKLLTQADAAIATASGDEKDDWPRWYADHMLPAVRACASP